jgi:hypothetical protein
MDGNRDAELVLCVDVPGETGLHLWEGTIPQLQDWLEERNKPARKPTTKKRKP